VSVVCCQVEVSAKVRSLAQRSPTGCGMSESAREASIRGGPGPRGAFAPWKEKQIMPCYVMAQREKEAWQGNRTRHQMRCTV